MIDCPICGRSTANRVVCSRKCAAQLPGAGGRGKIRATEVLPKKILFLQPSGYPYYKKRMLTAEEILLLPDSGPTVLVHRLVCAKKYGRPIRKNEVVRHVNGNKKDFRPENLILGSAKDNRQDHLSAVIEAEKWRNFSLLLFYLLMSRKSLGA